MKKSIKTHFALLFALLALAPIAIIFAIYSPGVIRELTARSLHEIQSSGNGNVKIASLWIKKKAVDVRCLADSQYAVDALGGASADGGASSDFLHTYMEMHDFQGLYVIDRNGNIKAAIKEGTRAGLSKNNVKKRCLGFRKGTSVKLVRLDEPAGTQDKHPVLSIVSPVLAGTEVVGTVVAQTDLSGISKALRSTIGPRKGCMHLIDKEGSILFCFMESTCPCCNDTSGELVNPQTGELTFGVKACLSGKGGFSPHVYINHAGQEVLGAWEWLPDLETGVIVEINAQELFQPVTMVKKRLFSLLLIIGVGIVVVSIFVGRRVSEPLISLTETAKKIAAGNLEERSSIQSQDELGELADSINTMVESIQKKHTSLEEANEKLAAASVRDGLTGLYNHYRFQELMDSEYRRARRYNLPLCMLMIDIDNFKLINDTHGHPFGDYVLKELTTIINRTVRDTDISSRYGGEEFTVILPNTELDGAYAAAEKLRQAAASHPFEHDGIATRLTLTIGISSMAEEGIETKDDMIKHADEAMYEGKIRGKNMVVSWGEFVLWERLSAKEEGESTEHYRKRFVSTARNVKRSYMETSMALIKTLEAKDGFTATHCYLVTTYAVKLAEELELPQEKMETIKNAATLHDIGKIAIPDGILKKTEALSEEEYNIIKKHPEQSVRILEGVGFLQKELPIILHHHERFDGKGYPHGLKGEEIPYGARILAICDAYEAMTCKRPYRQTLTYKAALEEIRREAGEGFDPDLVEPFIRAINKLMATIHRIYIPQLNKMVDIR